ncbi:hypothetical protein [Blastococcus goldschmidtiae]|uniref:Lipoprotein n=1 Tax=Blastococcus goldschmidtiae TaxID=3075546 RepID=A0ABU2K9A7_9ACTN|nr:hypothetical protein [Blastococcus sp. DSM 46792]MDT0276774.1 hypothetical protein [Blastococcus sp. DSM 46792]
MRRAVASLAGAGALLLTGCAAAAEDDVRAVATAFQDPGEDPQGRCDLLAPATRAALEGDAAAPCPEAIADLPLPGGEVTSVVVWGDDAQVRIGGDVVFLSGAGGRWLVTAAACEPRGEMPYDCEVEGS